MNVILLAPTPPPHGGIAGWTKRMISTTLKNGWKVVVVDEKVTGKRDAYDGKKKNLWDEGKRCIRIWKDLNRALMDPDSKVVQACIPAQITSMLREIVSAIITKVHRRKFITHFRCTLPNMVNSKLEKTVFSYLISLSDCVFVLNSASADFLQEINSKKKYEVIPNFIENDSIKKEKQYNNAIKRITYVGGVIAEKGCDLIADVAKQLPEKEFRLIGNIDMDTSIFPQNVILLGEKDKDFVQQELDTTDVFMFLSRYSGEGFSNALAEAMSHAIPCIVSNWAANKDMIEKYGGIVLEQYNAQNVVTAVYKMEDAELRKKMGQWNCQKVIRSYSDKVVTDMYVEAYEKIIV